LAIRIQDPTRLPGYAKGTKGDVDHRHSSGVLGSIVAGRKGRLKVIITIDVESGDLEEMGVLEEIEGLLQESNADFTWETDE
jgi:hypothetical protein